MRVIALSDTHGQFNDINRILHILKKSELIIHCGDYVADAAYITKALGLPVISVKGNGDFASFAETDRQITVLGHKIFITHGHKYNVKLGISQLLQYAESIRAGIVMYGHTHKAEINYINGIWFINPGTLGGVRGDGKKTYVVIDIEESSIKPDIIALSD